MHLSELQTCGGGLQECLGSLFTYFFTRRPDWTLRTNKTLKDRGHRTVMKAKRCGTFWYENTCQVSLGRPITIVGNLIVFWLNHFLLSRVQTYLDKFRSVYLVVQRRFIISHFKNKSLEDFLTISPNPLRIKYPGCVILCGFGQVYLQCMSYLFNLYTIGTGSC